MSNKVTFSTNQYVQEELNKLRLEVETADGGIRTEIKETVKEIYSDIDDLKTTINEDIGKAIEETNKAIEDLQVSISEDLDDLSKNILVENIEYTNSDYAQISNVKNALDLLLYKDLVVTLTTPTSTTNEKGIVLSDVIFNWTYSRNVQTQSIDGVPIHADGRTYKYPQPITTNKTVTLAVNDFVKDFTKSISFKFMNGAYYGVSSSTTYDSNFVKSLTKTLTESRQRTFTVNCGIDYHIFYCIPSTFGTPTFSIGGFEGGFTKVSTIDFTNASGFTEKYDIWKSNNHDLGTTTIVVK